jgi:hypothetical protein
LPNLKNIVILTVMNRKKRFYNIDLAYPFFCAVVVSAFICVFVFLPRLELRFGCIPGQNGGAQTAAKPGVISPETADAPAKAPVWARPPAGQLSLTVTSGGEDQILTAYRDPALRDYVTDFFAEITHSREIAQFILANADTFDIPPAVAFALCWEESRFKVRAINRKNRDTSTDRGLFQLNNNSFPELSEKDFFDPQINTYYGLSHLRWCLDSAGSLVAGLAMYNAGTVRVKSEGAPKRTLDYVSNILDSKQRIETLFEEHGPNAPALALGTEEEEEIEEQSVLRKPRLALLSPIW